MYKDIVIVVVCFLSLSGCVSVPTKPLSVDVSNDLDGKTVAASRYPKPNFVATTAGKAMFGMIGVGLMIAAGNEIINENGVEDPAIAISEELEKQLHDMKGMRILAQTGAVETNDDIASLVANDGGANYLIDVKTINWTFVYYLMHPTHYRVFYSARVRFIDSAKKAVVAQTLCKSMQGDDADPPSKEQLLENKAALLKNYLGSAARDCVDVVFKNILQL